MSLVSLITSVEGNIFFEIALIIIIASVIAYIIKLLRQPLIPAYIITGIILGPIGLGIIRNQEIIAILSEIGIAFLLFFVGLEIDFKKLKKITGIALIITIIQVVLTFIAGFYLSMKFGFAELTSIYIGLIVAFSSTMIVIKLLSDKDELDTLHSRLILGILLIQDIIVILVLSVLTKIDEISLAVLPVPLLKGIGLIAVAIFLSMFVFPTFFSFAAKSSELLLICALSICFLFSLLASSIGFSIAIGAFIAGLSLANLPYHIDIAGLIRPLKDFFALLFFVSLGMQLFFTNIVPELSYLVYLFLIIILLKPLIILLVTSVYGYDKRTSFLTAMPLAQTSEFSLIIVALGLSLGHIPSNIFSLTVLITIATMVLTSYLIQYDKKIYNFFSGLLGLFESLSIREEMLHYLGKKDKRDIILIGCHRMGSIFLNTFRKIKKRVFVIEWNPEIIKQLIDRKINCLYGDLLNTEVLKKAKINKAKYVISTFKDEERSLFLIDYVKKHNKKAIIIVTARFTQEAIDLYKAGADYVIIPHILSAEKVSDLLRSVVRKKAKLRKIRRKHLSHLEKMFIYGRRE